MSEEELKPKFFNIGDLVQHKISKEKAIIVEQKIGCITHTDGFEGCDSKLKKMECNIQLVNKYTLSIGLDFKNEGDKELFKVEGSCLELHKEKNNNYRERFFEPGNIIQHRISYDIAIIVNHNKHCISHPESWEECPDGEDTNCNVQFVHEYTLSTGFSSEHPYITYFNNIYGASLKLYEENK